MIRLLKPAIAITILAESEAEERRLMDLAEFFDIETRVIRLADGGVGGLFERFSENDKCLVMSAVVLAKIRDDQEALKFRSYLSAGRRHVLLYNAGAGADVADAVRRLTDGTINPLPETDPPSDGGYRVSHEPRDLTRQLSGLTFDWAGGGHNPGLAVQVGDKESAVLISRGDIPVLTRTRLESGASLFISAHPEIVDVHQRIEAPWSLRGQFLSLIPVLMFLRSALGEFFWQAAGACANLTIDDPLLRRSYGFMDYERLLSAMDRKSFFTTIAFIPRNLIKSRESACRLVRQRPDRYGICVHGLSHSHHEFGSLDAPRLRAMARTALELMREHERRTRLPWDDVMVFPQGRFSSDAMVALRSGGFSAAVNSIPTSTDDRGGLSIGDLIGPAHSKYGGFPLFLRRYPVCVSDFAIDLFLGRPAILVEHHGWFKVGYEHVEGFIGRVNSLDPDLAWKGLRDVALCSYWHRRSGPLTEVKIFCGRARIENQSGQTRQYLVHKKEGPAGGVRSVAIDGKTIDFSHDRDLLKFRFDLPPGKAALVEVIYRDMEENAGRGPRLREKRWAAMRRGLAAFRDDTVSQSDLLSGAVSRLTAWYRSGYGRHRQGG